MSALDEARQRIANARVTGRDILDLGDLKLDSLPEELGNLPRLHVLSLGKYAVQHDGEELKWNYDLDRPAQSFTELNVLRGLTNLQTLDLSWCQALTNVDGLEGLTNLQSLILSECQALTNVDGLEGLANLQ